MRKLNFFVLGIIALITAGCQTGRIDPLASGIDQQAKEDLRVIMTLQARCRHLLAVDYSYGLAQTLRDDVIACVETRGIPWVALSTTSDALDYAVEKARQKDETLALVETTIWREGCPLDQINHWLIRSAVISQATDLQTLGLTPEEFAAINAHSTTPTDDNQVAQEI